MPVHSVKGQPNCYQWGKTGKIYCGDGAKEKAERQGRAIIATGWKEAEQKEFEYSGEKLPYYEMKIGDIPPMGVALPTINKDQDIKLFLGHYLIFQKDGDGGFWRLWDLDRSRRVATEDRMTLNQAFEKALAIDGIYIGICKKMNSSLETNEFFDKRVRSLVNPFRLRKLKMQMTPEEIKDKRHPNRSKDWMPLRLYTQLKNELKEEFPCPTCGEDIFTSLTEAKRHHHYCKEYRQQPLNGLFFPPRNRYEQLARRRLGLNAESKEGFLTIKELNVGDVFIFKGDEKSKAWEKFILKDKVIDGFGESILDGKIKEEYKIVFDPYAPSPVSDIEAIIHSDTKLYRWKSPYEKRARRKFNMGAESTKPHSVTISRSSNSEKKLMAVFEDSEGKKIKTTHFGQRGASDYTKHGEKERMERYLERHGGGTTTSTKEDWKDPTTAGALSRWILWNKPSLSGSFADFKRRFGLKGNLKVSKSAESSAQKSLKKWTKEDWGTKSGKPSTQGKTATGERYLPAKAIDSLTDKEYARTSAKKRRDTKKGKQFSDQPDDIEEKVAKYRADENKCPPATQDSSINSKNQKATIENYSYGPMNVKEPKDYWEKIAKEWGKTVAESKKQNCGNCVAFDISPQMEKCGVGKSSDGEKTIGYCWMHHFKCQSARTCNTWAKGGPIKTDKVSKGWSERAFPKTEKKSELFKADSCRECGRKEGAYSDTKLIACPVCPELSCQHCFMDEKGCKFCFGKEAETFEAPQRFDYGKIIYDTFYGDGNLSMKYYQERLARQDKTCWFNINLYRHLIKERYDKFEKGIISYIKRNARVKQPFTNFLSGDNDLNYEAQDTKNQIRFIINPYKGKPKLFLFTMAGHYGNVPQWRVTSIDAAKPYIIKQIEAWNTDKSKGLIMMAVNLLKRDKYREFSELVWTKDIYFDLKFRNCFAPEVFFTYPLEQDLRGGKKFRAIEGTGSNARFTDQPDPKVYRDPALRQKARNSLLKGDKYGKSGQWSARKAQGAAKKYRSLYENKHGDGKNPYFAEMEQTGINLFQVLTSGGEVCSVRIGQTPSCDCYDFQKRKRQLRKNCKHIDFVIKTLKFRGLSDSERKQMLRLIHLGDKTTLDEYGFKNRQEGLEYIMKNEHIRRDN
tara:strand:- start:11419 stop:14814 length:3396 start_codon:yes stop_codon:yes gene_type:complete